jgi:hypothetical protein
MNSDQSIPHSENAVALASEDMDTTRNSSHVTVGAGKGDSPGDPKKELGGSGGQSLLSRLSLSKTTRSLSPIGGLSSTLFSLQFPARGSLFKGKRTTDPKDEFWQGLEGTSSLTVQLEDVDNKPAEDVVGNIDEENEEEEYEHDTNGNLILRDRSKELSKGRQRARRTRSVKPQSKKDRADAFKRIDAAVTPVDAHADEALSIESDKERSNTRRGRRQRSVGSVGSLNSRDGSLCSLSQPLKGKVAQTFTGTANEYGNRHHHRQVSNGNRCRRRRRRSTSRSSSTHDRKTTDDNEQET